MSPRYCLPEKLWINWIGLFKKLLCSALCERRNHDKDLVLFREAVALSPRAERAERVLLLPISID